MPVALFELIFGTVVFLTVVTQIVWPSFRGTPWFPILRRRREGQLKVELLETRQQQIERALRERVARETTKLGVQEDEDALPRQ